MKKVLILFLGVFTCSTAVIMCKLSELDAILLSSYRMLVAALFLMPLFLRDYRALAGRQSLWLLFRRAMVPGVLLGAHFIFWFIGARKTPSTNASLLVNMVPVVMPFLLYFFYRERLNRWELAGTVMALAGLAVLAGTDLKLSAEYFVGDLFCLFSMVLQTFYLVLARRNSAGSTLWLYIVPLYLIGGTFCLMCSFVGADPLAGISGREALFVLGLAIIPTVVGHACLNHCMRTMRGQVVVVAGLVQFVFAGILAYFILDEVPSAMFYPASALVVAGCVLAIKCGPQVAADPADNM